MLRRLPLLAACALLFACGADPAPQVATRPRKHRTDKARNKAKNKEREREEKRRELEREAELERQERKERQRQREKDDESETQEQRVAQAEDTGATDAKTESGDDAAAKKSQAEDAGAQEAEDAKARKKAEQEEAKARKQAAREEAIAKKKAAREDAKAKKLAALEDAKAKKQKRKDEDDEEAPTAAKKAAADDESDHEDEAPKTTNKGDDEEESDDEEEAPKAKKAAKAEPKGKKTRKAKAAAKVEEDLIEMEETSTAAIPDPEDESAELDLSVTPNAPVAEEPVPPSPLAIDRRPLTLGKRKLEVHGGLRVAVVTVPDGMGGTTSTSSQGFALGTTYGVGAKAEVGFDYTLGLHPGTLEGPLLFRGAYRVAESDKLDIAIAAGLAVDFVQVTDPATMMTTTETALGLQFGVWARYHVGSKLSLFSGLPAVPSSAGNLSEVAALPPLAYQLSIGVSRGGAIGLEVPVGAGYQATPKLYTFATLDLAHIGMSNTDSAFLFADFAPLALGGFYALNKIDIGAVLADDLMQGVDYLRFDVVARYSLK